jgi:hypothetical protein
VQQESRLYEFYTELLVYFIFCYHEWVPEQWECVFWNMIHLPMSSANPPTGTLHVPVTNCNRRARFSLSIDRTNWNIWCYISNTVNIQFGGSQTLPLYKPLPYHYSLYFFPENFSVMLAHQPLWLKSCPSYNRHLTTFKLKKTMVR